MVLIVLAWFVVTIIYIVVRATKSLKLGHLVAYGAWVLVVEGLGASTLLLYAFHLCLRPRKHTPPTVRMSVCCPLLGRSVGLAAIRLRSTCASACASTHHPW